MKYMESVAFKKAYGDEPLWVKYRRNHKRQFAPQTRETCIRYGTSWKVYVWSISPPTRQNILKRLCLMCFLSGKAEYQLEALVRYAEMNIWSWTTGDIMIVPVPGAVKIMILLLLMVLFVMVMLMLIIMAITMQELIWSTILIYSFSETWSCCSTSLTLTLGKLFQLRRQISVRNSSDFLTLRLREQKIMVLLKLMCLKLNTTTSCTRSKAEENINGQTRWSWSHSKEAWPFFREFWTKHELWHEWITWQSSGAGKKTVIIFSHLSWACLQNRNSGQCSTRTLTARQKTGVAQRGIWGEGGTSTWKCWFPGACCQRAGLRGKKFCGFPQKRMYCAVCSIWSDLDLWISFFSNVSGHIIGKGGETIAELRRSSCTNIMMSKANELFPGTQVRNTFSIM